MKLKTFIAILKDNKRIKKMEKEFRINKLSFRTKAYIEDSIKKCEKLLSEENTEKFFEEIKNIGIRVFFDCYEEKEENAE